jgi:hypothetical protein
MMSVTAGAGVASASSGTGVGVGKGVGVGGGGTGVGVGIMGIGVGVGKADVGGASGEGTFSPGSPPQAYSNKTDTSKITHNFFMTSASSTHCFDRTYTPFRDRDWQPPNEHHHSLQKETIFDYDTLLLTDC